MNEQLQEMSKIKKDILDFLSEWSDKDLRTLVRKNYQLETQLFDKNATKIRKDILGALSEWNDEDLNRLASNNNQLKSQLFDKNASPKLKIWLIILVTLAMLILLVIVGMSIYLLIGLFFYI